MPLGQAPGKGIAIFAGLGTSLLIFRVVTLKNKQFLHIICAVFAILL